MSDYAFDKILFLDIETVPQKKSLSEMPDDLRRLWTDKVVLLRERIPSKFLEEESEEESFRKNAGIYSEFGKIVCISVGYFCWRDGNEFFREKSFCGDDERLLLMEFSSMLSKFMISREHTICGHNVKEFDIPYICRRMLINQLDLPICLRISGKKPWEIPFVDTLELWRFGDYKNFTSLKLLTAVLGIPTPKDDIEGSQVATVYYEERDMKRISFYCEKDVLATARLLCRLEGRKTIEDEYVVHVE